MKRRLLTPAHCDLVSEEQDRLIIRLPDLPICSDENKLHDPGAGGTGNRESGAAGHSDSVARRVRLRPQVLQIDRYLATMSSRKKRDKC